MKHKWRKAFKHLFLWFTIILIPSLTNYRHSKYRHTNLSYEHQHKKLQWNTGKPNSRLYQKGYLLWPCWIHSRSTGMGWCVKINKSSPSHKWTQRQKSHDNLIRHRKELWQNSASLHDKMHRNYRDCESVPKCKMSIVSIMLNGETLNITIKIRTKTRMCAPTPSSCVQYHTLSLS